MSAYQRMEDISHAHHNLFLVCILEGFRPLDSIFTLRAYERATAEASDVSSHD